MSASASTRSFAYSALRPLRVPRKRRRCRSVVQPRVAGWLWEVGKVGVAHVEAQLLQSGPGGGRIEPLALERAPEVVLLAGVAQAGERDVEPAGAELLEVAADVLRAPDRHDRSPLGVQVPAAALRERLECAPVAFAFDKYDRTWGKGIHGESSGVQGTAVLAPSTPSYQLAQEGAVSAARLCDQK